MKRPLIMALLLFVLDSTWLPLPVFGNDLEKTERLPADPGLAAPKPILVDARLWWISAIHGNISAGENPISAVPGETIDLRDDRGMRREDLFRELTMSYALSPLSRIGLYLAEGKVLGETILKKTFSFSDNQMNAGEQLDTIVSTIVSELRYDHVLFHEHTATLGGGAGIGYYGFTYGFLAGNGQDRRLEDVRALAPSVRIEGRMRLTRPLSLGGAFGAGFPGLEMPGYGLGNVRFFNVRAAFAWHASEHVSAELGFNWLQVRARFTGKEIDNNYGDNRINLRVSGPSFGVTAWF
jgi:hypothetical protein